MQNINQSLHWLKTSNISHSQVNYGVSIVRIWKKLYLDRIWDCTVFPLNWNHDGKIISNHYSDIIMSAMASQITSISIVCLTVCSGTDQRKHQTSASLAFGTGNPPVTSEFPSQRASKAEKFSIWWCHHEKDPPACCPDYQEVSITENGLWHLAIWSNCLKIGPTDTKYLKIYTHHQFDWIHPHLLSFLRWPGLRKKKKKQLNEWFQ